MSTRPDRCVDHQQSTARERLECAVCWRTRHALALSRAMVGAAHVPPEEPEYARRDRSAERWRALQSDPEECRESYEDRRLVLRAWLDSEPEEHSEPSWARAMSEAGWRGSGVDVERVACGEAPDTDGEPRAETWAKRPLTERIVYGVAGFSYRLGQASCAVTGTGVGDASVTMQHVPQDDARYTLPLYRGDRPEGYDGE